jgi:RNA polymerase sigma factor (sigma-70 family)
VEGGRENFDELYARAYLPVLRYARRRVDPDAVADVVSEVFVVVWRRLAEVPSGDPLPWLYGVARRVVANQRRGADRSVRLADRAAALAPHAVGVPDPAETVTAGMTVTTAFERLSPDDREVLGLVVWEGLNARDAALVLGCSVAAVAARVSRARRRFRANLILLETEEY